MNDEDTAAAGLAHRRAWDLIPWVVNDTASAAERALVDAHLAGCTDCRDELAFHRRLRDGMARGAPEPPAVEPAWARMQARLDRVDGDGDGEAAANDAPGPARTRRSGWVVALAAVVVVQAVALGLVAGLWVGRDAPYQTLSQATDTPARAVVRIVPAPTLTLGQLRALLDRSGLQIVHSSADGAILGVAPQPGHPIAVEATVAALRRDPAVLLAEPIARAGHAP